MRRMYSTALLCAAAIALAGCEGTDSAGDEQALLETDAQKASYGIGRDIGRSLEPAKDDLDMDAFMRGVRETFEGTGPALPQQEIQAAVQRFTEQIQQAQQAQREAEGEANRIAGEEFLAENAQRDEVQVTESGLQYEVVEEGEGASPGPEDRVTIHYEGTLPDGTVFDSSRERGEPATFAVSGVIPGFSEGLQLMSEGATYRLYIPGDLAYGAQGAPGGNIGPNQTLIFEVEMIEVMDGAQAQGGQGG